MPYNRMGTLWNGKKDGNWVEKNRKDIIPEYNVNGAEIFGNAMKIIRLTYEGYHGYLVEWLEDNSDLTIELLNLCCYWYFPKPINTTEY